MRRQHRANVGRKATGHHPCQAPAVWETKWKIACGRLDLQRHMPQTRSFAQESGDRKQTTIAPGLGQIR